jgi:DNA polymerase-1
MGSPKQLKELFDALGETYSYTEKGNACFDADALERSQSPIAKLILKYRYHYKRAHTYFENFIWLADINGAIHCDLQQPGTETGRLSCWAPNLQNVSKTADKEEKDFPVRRCFIPRPGFFFADLDYQAAEYRMMLDYAGETTLIEKIKAGVDVHTATQEEMGIDSRHEAKTFNFALLYGAGLQRIADMLKITPEEAKERKARYFSKLGGVKRFIFNVRDAANARGFVINWAGRMLKYTRDTSFKAPNGLIQGGVGDLGKGAIIAADKMLSSHETMRSPSHYKSKLLLQVHDSLLFEIAEEEQHLI